MDSYHRVGPFESRRGDRPTGTTVRPTGRRSLARIAAGIEQFEPRDRVVVPGALVDDVGGSDVLDGEAGRVEQRDAVVGFAAAESAAVEAAFQFVFLGSLSTAMSDTLSSEIGVLFGPPRLITTLEPVETGTDGGVTFKGIGVGAIGGAVVAVIALPAVTFGVSLAAGVVIVAAGVLGMLVDSVLGATIEDRWIGNQAVNFLATLSGGVIAAASAAAFALV